MAWKVRTNVYIYCQGKVRLYITLIKVSQQVARFKLLVSIITVITLRKTQHKISNNSRNLKQKIPVKEL